MDLKMDLKMILIIVYMTGLRSEVKQYCYDPPELNCREHKLDCGEGQVISKDETDMYVWFVKNTDYPTCKTEQNMCKDEACCKTDEVTKPGKNISEEKNNYQIKIQNECSFKSSCIVSSYYNTSGGMDLYDYVIYHYSCIPGVEVPPSDSTLKSTTTIGTTKSVTFLESTTGDDEKKYTESELAVIISGTVACLVLLNIIVIMIIVLIFRFRKMHIKKPDTCADMSGDEEQSHYDYMYIDVHARGSDINQTESNVVQSDHHIISIDVNPIESICNASVVQEGSDNLYLELDDNSEGSDNLYLELDDNSEDETPYYINSNLESVDVGTYLTPCSTNTPTPCDTAMILLRKTISLPDLRYHSVQPSPLFDTQYYLP